MTRSLVAAAIVWPILLGAATWQRVVQPAAVWATVVYVAAGRVCHQRPERSFRTAGVQWPVCGRCSGLYLGASIGGWFAWMRRRRPMAGHWRAGLLAASLPTVLTLALEWSGLAPMTSGLRAIAALPLGAMLAVVLVAVSAEHRFWGQILN